MPLWLNVLLRSAGLFFLLFVLARALGPQHPTRINSFRFLNYVVIAVIASLVALNVVPNLGAGLIALGIFFFLSLALDFLTLKSKTVYALLHGRETILIQQGKVLEEGLQKARLTGEELLSQLRSKNVFSISDVEFAVLDPSGELDVLLKADKKPVTPYDLGLKVAPRREPQTVILEGNILHEQLAGRGLNQGWLKQQLESSGLLPENVFLGQVDSGGELYLDLYDDTLAIPQPQVKKLLYANLEKALADLEKYALETENREARNLYKSNAGKIQELLDILKPYLLR